MSKPITTTTTNNNNNPSNGKIVQIGQYRINKDKAVSRTIALDFLNPAEDFLGVIECFA